MVHTYHILNGDALKEYFPKQLEGTLIIMRECLVEGPVNGNSFKDVFKTRAGFISQTYPSFTTDDYYQQTVTEFEKIKSIPDNSEIYLWFEDDLFCQVNFWFVCYYMLQYLSSCQVYLVRPTVHTQYGFGHLTQTQLVRLYNDAKTITSIEKIAQLWGAFQHQDEVQLLYIAEELAETHPYILSAVKAHLDRKIGKEQQGTPQLILQTIIKDLDTTQFDLVFKEFCKRAPIYGFGDLQVKRLLDDLLNQQ